jgi:hypothetical protein
VARLLFGGKTVDDILILGRNDDNRIVKQFQAQFDVPAFVRRAQRVQEALDQLVAICRRQRHQWLSMPRIRLGVLKGLAGEWERLSSWLADGDQVKVLHDLDNELAPQLRSRIEPTSSGRKLQRGLQALKESLEYFNRRWQAFLPGVDLTQINELRVNYNRYYLLEKECAMRSPRLARQGFRRLEPLTIRELADLLPPLTMPQLKG